MGLPACRWVQHRCHPNHQQPNHRQPNQLQPHLPKSRQRQTSRQPHQSGVRLLIRLPRRCQSHRRLPHGPPGRNRCRPIELMSRHNGLPTSSTVKSSPKTAKSWSNQQHIAGQHHLEDDLVAASGPPDRRPPAALVVSQTSHKDSNERSSARGSGLVARETRAARSCMLFP